MKYDKKFTGKIIKNERVQKKWTQQMLGQKLGVTSKQVSKYESGELFPPLDVLTTLCDIFNCEIGYLLGEPQYADGTQLTTAIHEQYGLFTDSILAIQKITGTNSNSIQFGYESDKYTRILNRLLSSPNFIYFIECLGKLDDCVEKNNSAWNYLEDKYGRETIDKAMKYYNSSTDYEHDLDTKPLLPEILEICRYIDKLTDEQYTTSYQIKVARYELHESYNDLINELYPQDL